MLASAGMAGRGPGYREGYSLRHIEEIDQRHSPEEYPGSLFLDNDKVPFPVAKGCQNSVYFTTSVLLQRGTSSKQGAN